VHEKFCLLQQKELAVVGLNIIVRTRDSIEQTWKKRISRSVQLWNKHYRQFKGMLNKSVRENMNVTTSPQVIWTTLIDCFQMFKGLAASCCNVFALSIKLLYDEEYLHIPDALDLKRISKLHKEHHGVHGMFGSLDWIACTPLGKSVQRDGTFETPTVH
jgi:hypothetical protein